MLVNKSTYPDYQIKQDRIGATALFCCIFPQIKQKYKNCNKEYSTKNEKKIFYKTLIFSIATTNRSGFL